MWISKHDHNKILNARIMEVDSLKSKIRMLEQELAEYRDRTKAAPAGCMSGTHCAVCKHSYSTGNWLTEMKKFHCKLVAEKLCDRFEEATP